MPTDTRIADANASWDFNGHTYGLYKTLKTWDQANTFAESKGGYLVHVDTLAENSNLLQQVTANFTATDFNTSYADDGGAAAYVWLGASDAAIEGTWRWVSNGASLSTTVGATNTNWGSGPMWSVNGGPKPGTGEPDNATDSNSGGQDYLALGLESWPYGGGSSLGTAGQWNDVAGYKFIGNAWLQTGLYFVVELDPLLPTVQFSATSNAINEGNSGSQVINATVQLSAAASSSVTVPITYSGTATSGTDYTPTTSSITIAAGHTTASATFSVLGDTTVESNETVALTMGTPTNAILGANTTFTQTIVNDDQSPSMSPSIDAGNFAYSSGGFAVNLIAPYTTTSGKTYYFLDANGNGSSALVNSVTQDGISHDALDYFFNAGSNTSVNARTVSYGGYLFNLPTVAELNAIRLDSPNDPPIGWGLGVPQATYWTADFNGTYHTLYALNDGTSYLGSTWNDTVPQYAAIEVVAPNISFSAASSSLAEGASGNQATTVTVILSSKSAFDVTVPIIYSGTATSGTDYTPTTSSITIAAGQTTASATFSVLGDTTVESNETVVLTMGAPTNASLGANTTFTHTIVNDDQSPSITDTRISDANASWDFNGHTYGLYKTRKTWEEANTFAQSKGGYLVHVDTLAENSNILQQVTANFTTDDLNLSYAYDGGNSSYVWLGASDAAVEGTWRWANDGTLLSSTVGAANTNWGNGLGWSANGGTTKTGAGGPDNNTALSTTGQDYLAMALEPWPWTFNSSEALGYAGEWNDVGGYQADLVQRGLYFVVELDPLLPTVQFTAASSSANEGNSGSQVITAAVQLSSAASSSVTVPITYSGTATSGTDYTPTTSSITIAAGHTTASATFSVLGDTTVESNETVALTMGTPTNAILGANTTFTQTIVNDDQSVSLPTIQFTVSSGSANEGNSGSQVITATVQLSVAASNSVTVPITYSGTATSGTDYIPTTSSITIAAGQTTASATFSVLGDSTVESNETVVLTMGTPTNANLGANTTFTQTITNDDQAGPATAGNDVLYGTNGNDVIAGGAGNDTAVVSYTSSSSNLRFVTSASGSYAITAAPVALNLTQTNLWSEDGMQLLPTSDGGFYVAATSGSYSAQITDILVAKFRANGELDTSFSGDGYLKVHDTYTQSSNLRLADAVVDAADNLYLYGNGDQNHGTPYLFWSKVDASGNQPAGFHSVNGNVTYKGGLSSPFAGGMTLGSDGNLYASAVLNQDSVSVFKVNTQTGYDSIFQNYSNTGANWNISGSVNYWSDIQSLPDGSLYLMGAKSGQTSASAVYNATFAPGSSITFPSTTFASTFDPSYFETSANLSFAHLADGDQTWRVAYFDGGSYGGEPGTSFTYYIGSVSPGFQLPLDFYKNGIQVSNFVEDAYTAGGKTVFASITDGMSGIYGIDIAATNSTNHATPIAFQSVSGSSNSYSYTALPGQTTGEPSGSLPFVEVTAGRISDVAYLKDGSIAYSGTNGNDLFVGKLSWQEDQPGIVLTSATGETDRIAADVEYIRFGDNKLLSVADSIAANHAVWIQSVNVTGKAYHWNSHAMLADTALIGQGASSLSVAVSADATGSWHMDTVPPDSYALSATRSVTDIGNAITSADALAALRLAVGLNPNTGSAVVSPYQFMAADVVGTDGKVTAADALAILRMAVKLPSAPANEWMFVEDTRDFWDEATNSFTIDRNHTTWDRTIAFNANADQNVNLVGVLKGDVNGSWAAPANTPDLDISQPSYFNQLHDLHGVPLAQMGLV